MDDTEKHSDNLSAKHGIASSSTAFEGVEWRNNYDENMHDAHNFIPNQSGEDRNNDEEHMSESHRLTVEILENEVEVIVALPSREDTGYVIMQKISYGNQTGKVYIMTP